MGFWLHIGFIRTDEIRNLGHVYSIFKPCHRCVVLMVSLQCQLMEKANRLLTFL